MSNNISGEEKAIGTRTADKSKLEKPSGFAARKREKMLLQREMTQIPQISLCCKESNFQGIH